MGLFSPVALWFELYHSSDYTLLLGRALGCQQFSTSKGVEKSLSVAGQCMKLPQIHQPAPAGKTAVVWDYPNRGEMVRLTPPATDQHRGRWRSEGAPPGHYVFPPSQHCLSTVSAPDPHASQAWGSGADTVLRGYRDGQYLEDANPKCIFLTTWLPWSFA